MVIEDMENGDQVSKRGYLCSKDSRGGAVITQKILGRGVITPRILGGSLTPITPLIYATVAVFLSFMVFLKTSSGIII